MANCKFSETQFSFCFTFEFIKSFFPVIPLPLFPSTVREGMAGGYDVNIDGNIFFQFKVPRVFTRRTAKVAVRWDRHGKKFYVFKIKTNGKQFELLKGIKTTTNEVYYCAPEFASIAELEDLYYKYQIVNHSAWFPIEAFPPPNSGNHELTYSAGGTTGVLYSEPRSIEKELIKSPSQRFERTGVSTIYKEAQRLIKVIDRIDERVTLDINRENQNELVKRVHSILISHFNTHWYPVVTV